MDKNMDFVRKLLIIFIVLGLNLYLKAQGTPVKAFADKNKTSVTYSMNHPLHQWDGTSKDVSSVIIYNRSTGNITSVAVLIKIATFDSQNANRDSHMIEVLEGIKYPQVSFSSTSVITNGSALTVNGNLIFHGVSQPISFPAVFSKNGNELMVNGNFDVKMTTYKVDPPSLLGLACEDLIKIKFSATYNLP
jgi:polyisoprenoid-binding protein YceI